MKNLTETLAVEWAPYGIRVNGLVPGLMPHEDETAAIAAVPGKYEGQDSRVPAGRVGLPRELAWAATYLCSPYAAYISGHSLVVDGANWQRRHTVQPPFVPIRDQLGRPPFGRRTHGSAVGTGRPIVTDRTEEERDLVRLEVDGPVAVITNNRPDKHNAMSDEMDRRLWEVLAEVHEMPSLRAIVWRGAGSSFSSGRDTTQLGLRTEDISDLEFIERGHRPTQMFLTMPCPIVCALKGWVIGGAFERALLCDIRVAAAGHPDGAPRGGPRGHPRLGRAWRACSRWPATGSPPTWPSPAGSSPPRRRCPRGGEPPGRRRGRGRTSSPSRSPGASPRHRRSRSRWPAGPSSTWAPPRSSARSPTRPWSSRWSSPRATTPK